MNPQLLPTFCRWSFLPVFIAVWGGAAVLCALSLDAIEPFGEMDCWFYINLYTVIGVMFGVATWYFARLAACGRRTLRALSLALVIPYCFILLVSIDSNSVVSAIATIGFGGILLLAYLARRSAELAQSTRCQH